MALRTEGPERDELPSRSRWLWWCAVYVAVAAVVLVLANLDSGGDPDAGGPGRDERFLSVLGDRGVVDLTTTPPEMVRFGRGVCPELAGADVATVARRATVTHQWTLRQAQVVVDTARETYCPGAAVGAR